jgi:hypothetical protein
VNRLFLQKNDWFMATREEVEVFLDRFHTKLKIYSIIFRDDRGKNAQALADLEITPTYREEVIKAISTEDYSEGPIIDILNRYGEMWVFGKDVKNKEVYIKIAYGCPDSAIICISFHKAEHTIKYPFKK